MLSPYPRFETEAQGTRKWPTRIAKCLFPYQGDLPENFGQTTAQEYNTTSSD